MARKGVDTFGKAEFEAALPRHEITKGPLFFAVGLVDGEECYIVRPFANSMFGIIVRSSIGPGGTSAGCGEDSIRACIVKLTPPAPGAEAMTWEYYGGKSQRWVTRVSGWGDRLTAVLRKLANQILWLARPCPKCGAVLVPFTSRKKASPVKGQGFVRCESAQCYDSTTNRSATFFLTDEDDGEPIKPPAAEKKAPPVQPAGRTVSMADARAAQAALANDGSENAAMARTIGQNEGERPPAPPTTDAAGRCPKCGKDTFAPSKFARTPGDYYCFPKRGGCGYKGHADEMTAATDDDNAPRGVAVRPQDFNETPRTGNYAELRALVVAALEAMDDTHPDTPFCQGYNIGPVGALKNFLRHRG